MQFCVWLILLSKFKNQWMKASWQRAGFFVTFLRSMGIFCWWWIKECGRRVLCVSEELLLPASYSADLNPAIQIYRGIMDTPAFPAAAGTSALQISALIEPNGPTNCTILKLSSDCGNTCYSLQPPPLYNVGAHRIANNHNSCARTAPGLSYKCCKWCHR